MYAIDAKNSPQTGLTGQVTPSDSSWETRYKNSLGFEADCLRRGKLQLRSTDITVTDRKRNPALASPSSPAPGQCMVVRLAVRVRPRARHRLVLPLPGSSLCGFDESAVNCSISIPKALSKYTAVTRFALGWLLVGVNCAPMCILGHLQTLCRQPRTVVMGNETAPSKFDKRYNPQTQAQKDEMDGSDLTGGFLNAVFNTARLDDLPQVGCCAEC
ncbi:hypothetical protein V8F20_005008 [Naviculisporaceae sp. PSN 640]